MDSRYGQSSDPEKSANNSKTDSKKSWLLIFVSTVSFVLMCTLVGITGAYMHDKLEIVRKQTGGSEVGSWVVVALVLGILGSLWNISAILMLYTAVIYRPLFTLIMVAGDLIGAGLLHYVTVIYGRYLRPIDCDKLDDFTFGTNFWEQGGDHSFATWGITTRSRCGRVKAVPGIAGTVACLLVLGSLYLMYLFVALRRATRS